MVSQIHVEYAACNVMYFVFMSSMVSKGLPFSADFNSANKKNHEVPGLGSGEAGGMSHELSLFANFFV